MELYRRHSPTAVFPPLTDLISSFRSELAQFDDWYIIIDALDEIPDEANRLLILESLTLHAQGKIMVTSRPLQSIQNLFTSIEGVSCDCRKEDDPCIVYEGNYPEGRDLRIFGQCYNRGQHKGQEKVKRFVSYRLEIEAIEEDVRLYVQTRIDHEPRLLENVRKKAGLREEILSTTVRQSNGMFLLAKLHMNELATMRTPKTVQKALHGLPKSIDDTYDQALQRVKALNEGDQKLALLFLSWVTCAARPLSSPEIEHACSMDSYEREIDPDEIITAGELASLCAGLVVIEASHMVRLVHFSAQDYFKRNQERWFHGSESVLAQTCLSYLTMAAFDSGPCSDPQRLEDFKNRALDHPLLDYSCCCWGYHAFYSEQTEQLIQNIMGFLQNRAHRDSALQAMWYSPSLLASNWDGKENITPLHLAAYFGLDVVVSRLVDFGAAVDSLNSGGATPLMYAAQMGHSLVVQHLLDRGANSNFIDACGGSSLRRAITYKNADVVQTLLDHPKTDVNIIDTGNNIKTTLMLAVSLQRVDIVKILISARGLDVNRQFGTEASTALHCAVEAGNLDIFRLIMNHPKIDVNKKDRRGSPLMIAARNGATSLVEALLDHGAETEIRDEVGGTPLNRAVDRGDSHIVRLLLDRGADPKTIDFFARTIVHSAVINNRDETLRTILRHSAGIDINAQGKDGRTAMHDAAYNNSFSNIEILFAHGGRTDILDSSNRSPLSVARDNTSVEATVVLTGLRQKEKAGQGLIEPLKRTDSEDVSDETRFLIGAKMGVIDFVRRYISRARADPTIDLNVCNLDRQRAVHLALRNKHMEILNMLIGAGADLNAPDNLRRTPLHWSVILNDYEAASSLVKAGANLQFIGYAQETALDMSMKRNQEDITNLLLQHGARPQAATLRSLLFTAALSGDGRSLHKLAGFGADPRQVNSAGLSPYRVAVEAGNTETAEVMLSLSARRK